LVRRRHPKEAVKFFVALLNEWMRTANINWLPRQQTDGIRVAGYFIVRQMRMEVKGDDTFMRLELIDVSVSRRRLQLFSAFHSCRVESILIHHWYTKPLHQWTCVLAEALLARDKRVAMMPVFHLALLHVGGEAYVMMR